MAAANVKFWR